jgi:hypothetical protein
MKQALHWLFHGDWSLGICLILFLSMPAALFLLSLIKSRIPSFAFVALQYLVFSSPLLLYFYFSYPGIYLGDSVGQLKQALDGSYNDWHPPLLSALWGILIDIFATPTALYWLLAFLFLIGWSAFFIVFKINGLSNLSIFLLSACFAIVGLTLFGVILKDVVVAYALFAASGVVALSMPSQSRSCYAIFPVCILLFLAIISRHNALPAVLPILFFLFYRCFSKNRFQILYSLLIVGAFSISSVLIVSAITSHIEAKKWNIKHAIMLHDLGYFQKMSGIKIIPEIYQTDKYSEINLHEALKTRNCEYIINSRINPNAPFKVIRGEENNAIDKIWFEKVLMNPLPYARHRLLVFGNFLSLGNNKPWHFYYPSGGSDNLLKKNNIFLEDRFPKAIIVEHIICKSLTAVEKISPIYLGWFWLLINILLVFISAYKLNQNAYAQLAFSISLSGLVYFLFYVIIAPCPSFRYFYWPILACISSLFLLQISKARNA